MVWGRFITAKPAPAEADLLWVTLPSFDRHRLSVQVDVLFDPVVARRLYGIAALSSPEGSAYLSTLLDGRSVSRAFTSVGWWRLDSDAERYRVLGYAVSASPI